MGEPAQETGKSVWEADGVQCIWVGNEIMWGRRDKNGKIDLT